MDGYRHWVKNLRLELAIYLQERPLTNQNRKGIFNKYFTVSVHPNPVSDFWIALNEVGSIIRSIDPADNPVRDTMVLSTTKVSGNCEICPDFRCGVQFWIIVL
jgi:hypothetical protein